MNSKETFKAGHKKTIIYINVDELINEKLRSLKKEFSTSGTYRRDGNNIELEINGHFNKDLKLG